MSISKNKTKITLNKDKSSMISENGLNYVENSRVDLLEALISFKLNNEFDS